MSTDETTLGQSRTTTEQVDDVPARTLGPEPTDRMLEAEAPPPDPVPARPDSTGIASRARSLPIPQDLHPAPEAQRPPVTHQPVAGVDLDLARAVIAQSAPSGQWTPNTSTAAQAAMATAVRVRQDQGNADRIKALTLQLQRLPATAEVTRNSIHERAVTAQMWDYAVTPAPESLQQFPR